MDGIFYNLTYCIVMIMTAINVCCCRCFCCWCHLFLSLEQISLTSCCICCITKFVKLLCFMIYFRFNQYKTIFRDSLPFCQISTIFEFNGFWHFWFLTKAVTVLYYSFILSLNVSILFSLFFKLSIYFI